MAGGQRNPARDKGLEIYLEKGGEIKNAEIAKRVGATADQIRKWKCVDKWKEKLTVQNKPKRGGQPGNQNAKGHGAKKGNENALKHGAYKAVKLEDLPKEEREQIEAITLDTEQNLLRELKILLAKECDLRRRFEAVQQAADTDLYVDRVVEMLRPQSKEEVMQQQDALYDLHSFDGDEAGQRRQEIRDCLKTAMKTVMKSSPFERSMKLEAEWNKTHGRILKLLDTIKSYQLESKKISMDEKKYVLMKQKITGAYDIGEDGEIDDTYTEDGDAEEGIEGE